MYAYVRHPQKDGQFIWMLPDQLEGQEPSRYLMREVNRLLIEQHKGDSAWSGLIKCELLLVPWRVSRVGTGDFLCRMEKELTKEFGRHVVLKGKPWVPMPACLKALPELA